MSHLHKNIIHVGRSKFHGSMLSLPFHFCYGVISLQLEVACLEDKWGDVVGLQNMCGPITEVAVMAVKEEDLGIDLASSTGTQPSLSIYPDGILLTSQSLGRFQ